MAEYRGSSLIQDCVLLPDAIDIKAVENPTDIWAECPVSSVGYTDGYHKVTYRQLGDSVNRATEHILRIFGRGVNFETLAYIGPNDLRYPMFIVGALKAGYQLLLLSPRNSVNAHQNLLQHSACRKAFISEPTPASLQQAVEALSVRVEVPPSLQRLLAPSTLIEGRPSADCGRFSGDASSPLVVLQTSGTTDLPKPIVIPLSFAIVWSRMSNFTPKNGRNQTDLLHGRRLFCTLPMFHAVGVYFGLVSPVYRSTTFVQPPSQKIPTAVSLCDAGAVNRFDSAFVSPSIIEEIAKDSDLLGRTSGLLQSLAYTGGDLPQWAGDTVAPMIQLFTIYGTTEIGHGPQIMTDNSNNQDWGYLSWDEKLWGARFQKYDDDLYELHFEKDAFSTPYQAAFTIFPEEQLVRTKDLFSRHPSLPNHWRYRGRSDDTLVFATGEKTNPLLYEAELSSHPEIRVALVIGDKRFQTALLIEPVEGCTASQQCDLLGRLWPAIEAANSLLPSYAKVLRSHVLITTPGKPLVRAGKGTVIRRLSIELYADEIETLYAQTQFEPAEQSDVHDDLQDISTIQTHIRDRILEITHWEDLGVSEDFFVRGMDSLQALQLQTQLRGTGGMNVRTIYQNPTLELLSSAIQSSWRNSSQANEDRQILLQKELDTHRRKFERKEDIKLNLAASIRRSNVNVVLTGSTGTLGVYVLKALLDSSSVGHVYCLCRGTDFKTRQEKAISQQELSYDLPGDRVSFIEMDLTKENLGWDTVTFTKMAAQVDIIIHNAWKVDFAQTLRSFDEHLTGVINLLELARAASPTCRFTFVSSISAVQRYPPGLKVPEMLIRDESVCADNGYGQSKWLAEQLVDFAAVKFDIPARVVRIGQITGASTTQGVWASNEWLPSMITTSHKLGSMPSTLPFSDHDSNESIIQWTPVDVVAGTLTEAALQDGKREKNSGAEVFHISNQWHTKWSEVLPVLLMHLNVVRKSPAGDLGTLPYSSWLDSLHRILKNHTGESKDILGSYPALKLLDFFDDGAQSVILPLLDTQISSTRLKNLKHMQKIDGEFLSSWIEGWIGHEQ